MRLHERVGEIFLANETDEVQAAFSASLARFRVEDAGIFAPGGVTVRNELRVALLVESPHTDEPDCCINSYVLVRETPLYKGYFAHWPVRLRFTPSEDKLHRRDTCFALLLQHELPLSIAFYATGR